MKPASLFFGALLLSLPACRNQGPEITMAGLLDEMTDLNRLTRISDQPCRVVQFSSYDRRSKNQADTTWFCNDDGFGGEPIPGFEKVLVQPDSGGTGEYLICDIKGPGAVQRLWTAAISGKIRFYLDDTEKPVYEGDARDFFWNPLEKLAGLNDSLLYSRTFRQFDATYLPIPFAKQCRIEWIGNIAEPHFYHVGVRIYDPDTRVETFSADRFGGYALKLAETNRILADPECLNPADHSESQIVEAILEPTADKDLYRLEGPGAIGFFQIKIEAGNLEAALRKTLLLIWFDEAPVPQVKSPLGDFFGAAPGLNPFQSLPFSVNSDSTLVCRFIMPFKKSARIEIKNLSPETVSFVARVKQVNYAWNDDESMHFSARWSISNNLTAQHTDALAVDIPYLTTRGTGRLVGAAAYLYNPSPVPTSWGNWWGEGDEKIFIDRDTFPSFFGTGSEDYFNYSWSSPRIFSYPYCGQPRNDGPDNRGYAANFRWHIADDIPYTEKMEFFMELRHHGVVPGFNYARIAYYYSLPGAGGDISEIGPDDIRDIRYAPWAPVAYLGSDGYRFVQAEQLAAKAVNLYVEEGKIWADQNILTWQPESATEKLSLNIPSERYQDKARIGLTLAHTPDGGTILFRLNGRPVKIDGRDKISLYVPHRTLLENHFAELAGLRQGNNDLIIEMPDANGKRKAQIDFVWFRK
jgi:hypothetical protein